MSETIPAKKKPVGNTTTEVLIGSAASKLETAVKSLLSSIDSITDMERKSEQLTLLIVNKEQQIEELDSIYKQKEDTKKYELDLFSKQYPEQLLESYLNNTNQVVLSKRAYNELVSTSKEFDTKLKQEMGSLEGVLTERFNNELKTNVLMNEKTNAELAAKLQQKDSEISLYQHTISRLEQEIKDARELTRSVAESGKIGSINLAGGK